MILNTTRAIGLGLILLGTTGPGETQEESNSGDGNPISVSSDDVTSARTGLWGRVVADPDSAAKLSADEYRLDAAAIRGGTLVLTVSYGGGCEEHLFTLDASAAFLESDPVQLAVGLAHNANGDACQRWVTQDYLFDLTPLKIRYQAEYRRDAGTIVLLLEGASGDLVYEFSARKMRVRPELAVRETDGSLRVTYTVLNVSGAFLRFVYRDGQQYEFALSDAGGEVWRWSEGYAFTQAMWEESLTPGASIVVEEPLPWPAGHKTLDLQAHLTLAPRESTGVNVTAEETRIGMRLVYGMEDGGGSEDELNAARGSDFDASGTVDFADFFAFAAAFGSSRADTGFKSEFDLDGDGRIGFSDFFILAAAFGIILPSP